MNTHNKGSELSQPVWDLGTYDMSGTCYVREINGERKVIACCRYGQWSLNR